MLKLQTDHLSAKRARRQTRNRGFAVVIVLGVISVALAVSYSMMRSQTMTMVLQNNSQRRSAAGQAANAGISAALQNINSTSWSGVGSTLNGQLSTTDTYVVSFTAGDPSLSATHPDWLEYPYRVTIESAGYSADPANSSVRATHKARAVVQLIRRQLSPAITGWSDTQNHTIYQWQNSPLYIEMPVRAEGPMHFQGPLDLFDDYPYKSKPFDGTIDEVALFNHALTPAEIDAIYTAVTGAPSGQDAMGTMYAAHNPTAWWRLDEAAGASIAIDTAGSNDGTYRGAVGGAAGAPNGAANTSAAFDGVNDYVDVGNMDLSGNAMTLLAWFRADDFDYNDARIISKATSASNDDHLWMLSTRDSNGSKRLRFRLRTNGWTGYLIATSGDILPNEWVFAAAVYDGTTMTLYKNGSPVGSMSKSGTINSDPTVPVYIGDNPPGSTRARYLRDLEAMRAGGHGDYRTFDGPIELPRSRSSDEDLSLLEDDLQLALTDVPATSSAPFSHPGAVLTYQLYTGGPVYSAMNINASSLTNTTLLPDMLTNPLGFYYANNSLYLYENVTIKGTLITGTGGDDLFVYGTNVKISPAPIPDIEGASTKLELPSALINDDIRIRNGSSTMLRGMLATWDEFEFLVGSATVECDFEGRLATGAFEVRTRDEWDESESWWRARANDFLAQLAGGTAYFPPFMEADQGFLVDPKIEVKPDPQPVTYHWQDWANPLFVPDPSDGALRWELVEWTDDL